MIPRRPVHATPAPATPRVGYSHEPTAQLLRRAGTLAVFEFSRSSSDREDPRFLHVALPGAQDAPLSQEHWQIDADVTYGREGDVGWARGGEWLFAHMEIPEAAHAGDLGRCAEHAYRRLCRFLSTRPQRFHVQRIWNYMDRINEGAGDAERYKQFCSGRAYGMGHFFDTGFPAATAIGLPTPTGCLLVYCLASRRCGRRIENPRQLHAWRYPRQYGRTPPSFARAMLLPARDALAISGTAAITGHASRHADSLAAQLAEIRANLGALLSRAGRPPRLGTTSPLKVYIRHREDAADVAAFLDEHAPHAPRLLLHGHICRRELRVEIDGWHYG